MNKLNFLNINSLLGYIYEAVVEKPSIWKRTAKNAEETGKIQDKLQALFAAKRSSEISLENKQEYRKLFKEFVNSLSFGNYTQNLEVLKKYGISDEEKFANFILSNKKEFEDHKFPIDWIKQFNPTKMEQEYKKAKDNGEIPDSISDEEAEERDLVIYYRWDPSIHTVKPFKGKRTKATRHDINMLCMDAKHELNIDEYYDCYPILAKNFFGHEEELKKRAEIQMGYFDPNEFD